MSGALYALTGTVIGILGTVLTDVIRGRREDRSRGHDVLRSASSDFTAQIGRVRRYCLYLKDNPEDRAGHQEASARGLTSCVPGARQTYRSQKGIVVQAITVRDRAAGAAGLTLSTSRTPTRPKTT